MGCYRIAEIGGDGIGPEVVAEAVRVLEAVQSSELRFSFERAEVGAALYERTGEDLPRETVDLCRSVDAILFGAAGLPDVRHADGTELVPQVTLRMLLDLYAGRLPEARAHVREVIELYGQTGASLLLINCLELCVGLCAAARRWREAITVWAAFAAVRRATWVQGESQADDPPGEDEFREPLDKAREALGPTLARAAEERGAAMTPAAAAGYVLLLVTEEPGEPAAAPELPRLSARERELVTLVARGRTDAQIAALLSISVRTVRSRLDRIRAKTGSQRRADLTRLALQANLV